MAALFAHTIPVLVKSAAKSRSLEWFWVINLPSKNFQENKEFTSWSR
jgi:hypothetical protein